MGTIANMLGSKKGRLPEESVGLSHWLERQAMYPRAACQNTQSVTDCALRNLEYTSLLIVTVHILQIVSRKRGRGGLSGNLQKRKPSGLPQACLHTGCLMDLSRQDTGKEYVFEFQNNHSLVIVLWNQPDKGPREQKSVVTKFPDLLAACVKVLELTDPNLYVF